MAKATNMRFNKKHGGKEFKSEFRFIGKVSPVQKKDEVTESWVDVPIFEQTTTSTNKPRNVLQFQVETAPFNRIKVELAGMEMQSAYAYSRTDKATHRADWADRFDKSKYPNDTYHLIETDWDKSERFGKLIVPDMWVDVRGHYEFDSFEGSDGKEIKLVKRVIDFVNPLRNGLLEITGLNPEEQVKVYGSADGDDFLGSGKADKDGVVSANIGWLNPEGGNVYVCKVVDNEEQQRTAIPYNEATQETKQFKITNNLETSSVRFNKPDRGYEYKDYVMDFNSEEFVEVNEFTMQLGIRSTYLDEDKGETIVNGVFLDYGKERSTPKDVELVVYHKEAPEGKKSLAQAFDALNPLDFMEVVGIDNNRVVTTMVEVQETDDDNPFADVSSEEKEVKFEQASAGTKKGLEITGYITGTYQRSMLTEEEISTTVEADYSPFSDVGLDDDSLPF